MVKFDRRWASVVVALYAALTTGTSYTFGIYSGALKDFFGFTQSQLESVLSFSYIFGLFSFLGGLVSDRWGSRAACLIGGAVGSMGFALFYAMALKLFEPSVKGLASSSDTTPNAINWPIMSVLLGFVYVGSSMVTGAVFSASVRNYPGQKGLVVGLVKAFVGIGAGVFTQLYVGFVDKPSASDASGLNFILYLSLITLIVNAIASAALATLPPPTFTGLPKMLQMRLSMVYAVLVLLLITVASVGIMEHWLSKSGSLAAACVVLVILLSPLISLIFDAVCDGKTEAEDVPITDSDTGTLALTRELLETGPAVNETPTPAEREMTDNAADGESNRKCTDNIYPLGRDVNLCGMLRTPEAWILLFCFTVNIGSGIMVTTNVSQMASALSLDPSTASTAVTLISCGNALGRLLAGLGSDILLGNFQLGNHVVPRPVCCGKMRTFPRPIWLAFALVLNTTGHLVMALGARSGHGGAQAGLFCMGCTLIGVGFGATFPLAVVITAELFGNANVGANYMFYDGTCGFTSGMLFGKLIPQTVYQAYSHDGGLTCLGPNCFFLSHMTQIGFNVLALLLILVVAKRTLALYETSSMQSH